MYTVLQIREKKKKNQYGYRYLKIPYRLIGMAQLRYAVFSYTPTKNPLPTVCSIFKFCHKVKPKLHGDLPNFLKVICFHPLLQLRTCWLRFAAFAYWHSHTSISIIYHMHTQSLREKSSWYVFWYKYCFFMES